MSDDKVIADLLRSHGIDEAKVRMVELLLARAPSVDASWWSLSPAEGGEGPTIDGGRRCAVYRHWEDWFVGISPRNGYSASVEGSFDDWCQMAAGILATAAVKP
jgi:hypothetical protein